MYMLISKNNSAHISIFLEMIKHLYGHAYVI